MVKVLIHIFFLLLIANYLSPSPEVVYSHKETLLLMGTRFDITATAIDQNIAKKAVSKGINEIRRIEELISSWKPTSQTSEINRHAGLKPIEVDAELFNLISRAIKISKLTDGAFDITFASMNELYQFDKTENKLPSELERRKFTELVDYESINLTESNYAVFLSKKNMKIGFGGIGKGYAANQAKNIMQSLEGVLGGVVNASGDLVVWGENGKDKGWNIQISDPKNINNSLGFLTVYNASVVTSGDYEKYFMYEGTRYAHIIDPHSGLPTTGIKSVTIVSPDCEVGDALATSVFVLGAEKGLELINRIKNVEVLIITDDDEILTSSKLILNKY